MRAPLLTLLMLSAVSCAKKAPDASPTAETTFPADLDAPLPVDPTIRVGTLANGLTYYIENNDSPQDRAVLRLVLDAGSVLEDDDQLGLAHVLEHMAFNGSEHFEGNELIDVMQAMGMSFGAHINAHTSFDETVYKLTVPTDSPELLDKAMLVFQDWAGGLTLSDEEIEKERGVVIEEWRRSLGASRRLGEQVWPLTYFGSPYPDRMPIGTLESLESFTPQAVRRYYKDWYRPDLMGFIAVGDFDVDLMEAKIKTHFGGLKSPDSPRERLRSPLPDHEPKYLVVTDKELPSTSLAVTRKMDDVESTTARGYNQRTLNGLAMGVLNERLALLTTQPGTPFMGAGMGQQRLTPTEGAILMGLQAREGQALMAYEAMLVEAERLRRFGVTQAELDRGRANHIRQLQAWILESENEPSSQAAEELIRVFTNGEMVTGAAFEVKMAESHLKTLTPADVNQAFIALTTTGSKLVVLTQPDKEGVAVPTVDELKAVQAKVAKMELEPPQAEGSVEPPVDTPEPGSIVERDSDSLSTIGFTRWTLSNGIQVYWKKTDFKDDSLTFTGWSPGGQFQHEVEDWVPGNTAVGIARLGGAGRLDIPGLVRWTTGKEFNVDVRIGNNYETFSGTASPTDFEAAMTMAHALVTQPRFDSGAFQIEKDRRMEGLRNRLLRPNTRLQDAWSLALFPDSPRKATWTIETLEHMDLARSKAIYTDRFRDLGDMNLIVVGAIPDDFETVITTWVATLPGGDRVESFVDPGIRAKTGPISVDVKAGKEPKANVWVQWHGEFESNTALARNRIYALRDILDERIREELREEKSGVYSAKVKANVHRLPIGRYNVSISFSCDPERVKELKAETLRIVRELQSNPVDAPYMERLLAQRTRSHEESLRKNSYWRNTVSGALKRGEGPVETIDAAIGYLDRSKSLTAKDVQAAAKKYLSTPNFVQGTLLPEDGE